MNPHIETTEQNPLTLTVHTLTEKSGIMLGLRQGWIDADAEGVEADLMAGAGLGSPYMTLHVTRPGKPLIVETIDMSDHLPTWINAAIARADEREEPAETAKRIAATGGPVPA